MKNLFLICIATICFVTCSKQQEKDTLTNKEVSEITRFMDEEGIEVRHINRYIGDQDTSIVKPLGWPSCWDTLYLKIDGFVFENEITVKDLEEFTNK